MGALLGVFRLGWALVELAFGCCVCGWLLFCDLVVKLVFLAFLSKCGFVVLLRVFGGGFESAVGFGCCGWCDIVAFGSCS